MTDNAQLADWKPRFQAWIEECQPLFAEGKAKEAFAKYPWFQTEGDPFARLAKPASETRFGLVTTGGYSVDGDQAPFTGIPDFSDTEPVANVVPMDVDKSKLVIHHHGYDHRFANEDRNVNLPFDRLKEMVDDGELGSVSNDSFVFMGLIPNVVPLIEKAIPNLINRFKDDGVEAALLVPS